MEFEAWVAVIRWYGIATRACREILDNTTGRYYFLFQVY